MQVSFLSVIFSYKPPANLSEQRRLSETLFCELNRASSSQFRIWGVSDRLQFLLRLTLLIPFGNSLPTIFAARNTEC